RDLRLPRRPVERRDGRLGAPRGLRLRALRPRRAELRGDGAVRAPPDRDRGHLLVPPVPARRELRRRPDPHAHSRAAGSPVSHRPRIEPVPEGDERPRWSVMIPAYECAGYLVETLESVLAQDPGPDRMQIEVVDDC